MRDPGTEPLEMISGDVVELTKMIYAERAAHAAEVARMREKFDRLLDEFDAVNTQCEGEILGECPALADAYRDVRAALAAPPTAAAQAAAIRKGIEAKEGK